MMGRSNPWVLPLLCTAMAFCLAGPAESARIPPKRGSKEGPIAAGYIYKTTGTGETPPMSKSDVNWSKGSTYADISLIFDSQAKLQKILGFGGKKSAVFVAASPPAPALCRPRPPASLHAHVLCVLSRQGPLPRLRLTTTTNSPKRTRNG